MSCWPVSSYPSIIPTQEPWPIFVVPSDHHHENPISEPPIMEYMFTPTERSMDPIYLPFYEPSVSNELIPCTTCT